MLNILSRYSHFLTSSFWSLERVHGVTSSKSHVGSSFLKNFSNRFLLGTHLTSGNSAANGIPDATSYQVRLVLRKLYLAGSSNFIYSDSSVEPILTDFVYFFFYKQSKFWYNYRSTYTSSSFLGSFRFGKSSNFSAINLVDRAYSPSCISEWRLSPGRFLTKKVFYLKNARELWRYTDPRFDLNRGGFIGLEHFSKNYGFRSNSGLAADFQLSNKVQFGWDAVRFLYYSGIHLPANAVVPFFQLKMQVASVIDNRSGPRQSAVETELLFNLEDGYSRLLLSESKLVGFSTYFLGCAAELFSLQKRLTGATRYGVASVFSVLPIFLKVPFNWLILMLGRYIALQVTYLRRRPNFWRLRSRSLGFILEYARTFMRPVADFVNIMRPTVMLDLYAVNTQLGRVVAEILLVPYFTDFGNSARVFSSWRFGKTGRVVRVRSDVSDLGKQLNLEKLKDFQVPHNLLLHFFTFLKSSIISVDGFRGNSLPRLLPFLIYFRRFLKNFVQYNSLFSDFFCTTLNSSARTYFDRILLQPKLGFNAQVVAPLAYSVVTSEWFTLLESQQNLNANVLGISDLSRRSLDLIRLGGSREHREFFSLYAGRNLGMVGKFKSFKNLLNSPYLREAGIPLNLEFLDTLVTSVFTKTLDGLNSVDLGVPSALDIDTSLSFAFEFQGAWFFNEFDVVSFSDLCYGVTVSETSLASFDGLRGFTISSVGLRTTNLKKKRQRYWEQVNEKRRRDTGRRIWSESSPEVLSGKVLIFKKPPLKIQWPPAPTFSRKVSYYWHASLLFNFFWV